jgi:tetratricopeptide (TPR) repeat protein
MISSDLKHMKYSFGFIAAIVILIVAPAFCFAQIESASFNDTKRKGELQLHNKDFLAAIETFTELLQADPTDQKIRNNLLLAYNAHGVDQINENDYLAAIYYLQKALDLAEEKEIINENLAVAYFHLGQQQETQKRLDDAVLSYQTAHELNPDLKYPADKLGMIFYNIGAKAYEDRDYTKAEEHLNRALSYRQSANVFTYHLLGRIAYFRQDLDKAQEYWEMALAQPDITEKQKKELEEEISKNTSEKKSEENLKDYRSDKFIIRYDQRELRSSAYKVNSVLQSAYRVVGRYFNHFPTEKITVIVYNADIFNEVTGGGHGGIRALYDGKIRLPSIDDKTDVTTFKSLLWHEYTHALVYEIAGARCPVWLNEGLAQIQEDTIVKIQTPLLAEAARTQKTIPFEQIFSKYDGIPKEVSIALFYQQSYSMTRYLLKRYQLYKVKKVLSDIKQNKSVEHAFQKHLFLTPERFEKNWLKSVGG